MSTTTVSVEVAVSVEVEENATRIDMGTTPLPIEWAVIRRIMQREVVTTCIVGGVAGPDGTQRLSANIGAYAMPNQMMKMFVRSVRSICATHAEEKQFSSVVLVIRDGPRHHLTPVCRGGADWATEETPMIQIQFETMLAFTTYYPVGADVEVQDVPQHWRSWAA